MSFENDGELERLCAVEARTPCKRAFLIVAGET
jgi:hypothetical protein